MADNIVGSLFGLSPVDVEQQLRNEQMQNALNLAQLNRSQRNVYTGQMIGGNIARGLLGSFGVQDPRLQKATEYEKILQDVQGSLTPEEQANPALVYQKLGEALAQNPNFQREAMAAQTKAAELGLTFEQKQTDIAAKQATIAKTQIELAREEQSKVALQEAAQAKGSPLTNEETIQVLSQYLPTDKLVPLLQTSQDKAAYRDAMLQQAQTAADARVAAAEARNANQKELEEIRQQNRIEIKRLESTLSPKAGAGNKVSVYERGYANQFVTSANELVPASQNLNILTNGGTSPVTAGMFSGLKGGGFLTATGSALGNTMTDSDSLQYESIMLPVIQNIGTIQNAGRRTTIAQLDNLKQALIAKPGQSYLAQLQKMGELRQIVEAASEAAKANPALSDEQKAQVESSVAKLGQFIPFTGTDVTKFSVYAKKNPNVAFKDWLKVNGSQAGQAVGKTVVRTGKVTSGPNQGKTVVEYSDGTREYK